jgi:mono/diheme cytochrome c family protein
MRALEWTTFAFVATWGLAACTGAIGRGEGSERGNDIAGSATTGSTSGSTGVPPGAGPTPGNAGSAGGSGIDSGGGTNPPPTDSLTTVYPESVLCPPPAIVSSGLSAGFASTCAGCHGPTGDGQGPFPSLKNVPTVDQFIATVRSGRNQMPAFSEAAVPTDRLRSDYAALHSPSTPPPATDPDCGPGSGELPPSTVDELHTRIEKGMEIFRKVGPKGACGGCHSATGVDLAFVGFSDATLLRRAIPQVGPEDAPVIVDLVHALRQLYHVDRPLHPMRFRFMQPGFEVLPEQEQPNFSLGTGPSADDSARDRAFGTYLRDEAKLLLAGDVISNLDQAKAAQEQLLALDLTKLPSGVPIEHWTEDGFHGVEHNIPNEWIPMLSRRVATGREAEWQALVDAYRADPSDANLWRYYDAIETLTVGEDDYALAERWSLAKYKSVQVAAHMMLHRSLKTPDPLAGSAAVDPVSRRMVTIAHNPFWATGDSIRQNPLNCDTPDPCTTFPPLLDATMNMGDAARDRMTYEDKVSWFWIGFTLDPALLTTEDALPSVDGDYFLAVTQQYYNVHNAFVVATIITHKANAPKEYLDMKGIATTGHGMWASPRPFLAFKQSERELHHPPPTDLRYPIHERIWANGFRMALYLMNDELARTGQVFDRARTLQNVEFIHHWFGLSLEVGQDHTDLDALVSELTGRLANAQEIGTVVVTEPGDAPDPVVLP